MKILQVNKFYYPKDGVSNYLLGLKSQLEAAGHEVRVFAMDNPKNIPSPDQKYFVSFLSFDRKGLINACRSFFRIFYSLEAKRKFSALIRDFHPDIIHIHNIYHQISPSILSVAKREHIPVVMHLHDYKLICPNYKLFAHGSICRLCQDGHYCHCFTKKCLKDSYLKSLGGTLEMYFHHKIWKIYERGVDLFIAPSRFMKETCEEFGWPAEKIVWLHNFFAAPANTAAYDLPESGDYLFYFGRLSEEKGIDVLLKAMTKIEGILKIAGEGPEEAGLKKMVSDLNLEKRVEFLGFKTGAELESLIARARAIIIPSIWYENMPLNMLEAMSRHKIVIASNIGGMPEIIVDGKNGFLFAPGDADELAAKIRLLRSVDTNRLTEEAAATVKGLDIATHVDKVLEIYSEVIAQKKSRII